MNEKKKVGKAGARARKKILHRIPHGIFFGVGGFHFLAAALFVRLKSLENEGKCSAAVESQGNRTAFFRKKRNIPFPAQTNPPSA